MLNSCRLRIKSRRVLLALAGVLLTLEFLAAAPVAARMFYLERPKLGVELSYVFQQDNNQNPSQTTSSRDQRFLESLTLDSRGFVYHPALLQFELDLTPTWQQQNESASRGRTNSNQAFYLDYGFSGAIFQYKPLSLNLRARRNTSTVSYSLSPTTSNENFLWGGTLVYKSRRLPASLSFDRSQLQQSGFFTATEDSDRANFTTTLRGERSQTSFNADYDNRQRVSQGLRQETENSALRLSNGTALSADRRAYLSSSASARRTTSNGDTTETVDISELLNWQHTPADQRLQINSSYSARYSLNQRDGERLETIPLDASLTLSHLLYENLRSLLRIDGGYLKFTGGENRNYGAQLDFGYTRRIPWGQLRVNANNRYQIDDRISNQEIVSVVDESHVLSSFTQTLLNNRNVDLTSVQVFRADKTLEYQLGADYSLTPAGLFARLTRLPTGSIADGETVLVSYQYQSDPSAKIATYSRSFGAGLTLWTHLTVDYQLSLADDSPLSGETATIINESTAQTLSVLLQYPWSESELTLSEEKNNSGTSLRSIKGKQKFTWHPRDNISLSLSGAYGESELIDSGKNRQSYDLRTDGRWQPRNNQQWTLSLFQLGEKSNVPDKFVSSGVGLFYLLHYGLWQVEADYKYRRDEQSLVEQKFTQSAFNLRLSRTLQ